MDTDAVSEHPPSELTPSEHRALDFVQHSYLAILATVYPFGGPQAFPVWCHYDGVTFAVTSPAESAKIRNIEGNRQAALCLTDTTRHVRSLTIRGRAQIVRDSEVAHRLHRKLSDRYIGHDEGAAWCNSMDGEELAIIRVTPDRFPWTR